MSTQPAQAQTGFRIDGVGYETMLAAVHGERIFGLDITDAGLIEVRENCDGWFAVEVTPAQLRALGQELIEYANKHKQTAPAQK